MADEEFFIYTDRSKFLTHSNTEYRVKKLLKPHALKKIIPKLQEELNTEGAEFIFKYFDELFSVIEYIDQIDYGQLHYIYENILVKSLNIIGSFFNSYGDIEDIDADLRYKYINIIKMTVYIFIEFVNSFNLKIETDYKLILLQTKGRNKKQDIILKHTSDYDWNWENKLCNGFKALNSIISNNITQLYDPPYIDHTFVSYIASCCYTQLENPSIAFVRTKHLRESIIQILVVFITEYDHTPTFKVKVVQLLKSYEHLSLPLARTVLQVVESGKNRSSIIELIVKEIAETKDLECIKETGNQEIIGGKSCCTFLVEIAKHCPQFVLPNIEHLLPCLESDPYSIRICVLSVLKELIIHVLNNNELDELERKIRDDYFSILEDHLLDINAFVRSKVLQLFTEIINLGCLPKQMYITIINCAKERLCDKSSYVIKSAILLIKTLIKLNPYSCNFAESSLQEIIQTEKCSLKNGELVLSNKQNSKINKEEMWLTIETPLKLYLEKRFINNSLECINDSKVLEDMELFEVLMKIKRLTTLRKFKAALKLILYGRKTFKEEPLFKIKDENNLSDQLFILLKDIWWSENTNTSTALSSQTLSISEFEQMTTEEIHLRLFALESKIAYLQECTDYLDTVKKAIVTVSQLLFGNTTSESLEAIDFFTVAYQFNIPYSEIGIESMILLINSAEPNIKAAVINSYKIIYLTFNENDDSKIQVTTIMTRLINLVKKLSITKRKAFTVLLNEWFKNKTLNNDCIMLLWSWFTKSITVSYEDRVLSALLLYMISSMNSTFVKGNLENIIKHGLCNDYELFVYSCLILQQNSIENFDRFTETHDIVNRLINVTQKCFSECEFMKFRDVSSNAINVIYELTMNPDVTCIKLIDELHTIMKNYEKNNDSCSKVSCNWVAKLLFVIGHIALKQYDYLENYVAKQLIKTVRDKYSNNKLKDNEEAHNDAEAAEIEIINIDIRKACDKLVSGNVGILSSFSKHVIKSCYSDNVELKFSGINTLVKFMLVSAPFCQKHIATFLNVFESVDKDEIIINLIISFGWLIFKHPNVLEPYTDKLYARLKDDRDPIRYSALITIVDLICQEMTKFRGQSVGIAKLVVDENEQIQNITKYFFKNIAEKGNTLYNVMSDIISILSNPHDAVTESDFQLIMKFLLSFINKERQIETLVDKLCTRLKYSEDSTEASYISYCLMLMKYTDKSLIKLSDNIPLYTNQLKNPKVYNNFIVLININSRLVKPATKEILTDLTDKIEKIVADEDFATALSLKTPRKRLTAVKRKPNKNIITDSSVHEIEPLQVATKQNSKYYPKVKRKLIVNDSEEENDEELARSSNNNQITILKVKKSCEINDDVNVLKRRTTRQTNLACSSKKNLQNKS